MCPVPTGVVMLVKGTAVPGGDFHVRDVRYARMAPQPPLPSPSGMLPLPVPTRDAQLRISAELLSCPSSCQQWPLVLYTHPRFALSVARASHPKSASCFMHDSCM